jgi:hypothetical protein
MKQWRKIPIGNGDYLASSDGEIMSIRTGTLMRQTVTKRNGYAYVKLYSKPYRAHRVILMAFAGLPEADQQCCHLNGDRTDNRPANLVWGTARENTSHKSAHGTLRGAHRGERHHNAKLTDSQRIECAAMHVKGMTQKQIAKEFGVHQTTIHYVLQSQDANQRQEMRMVRT